MIILINAHTTIVPPRWVVEPQDKSVILGDHTSIVCQADGFPMPAVIWKQAIGEQTGEYREVTARLDDHINKAASSLNSIESYRNGTLVILNVTRDHEGNFLCQANNGIGGGLSKLIRLTVHGTILF